MARKKNKKLCFVISPIGDPDSETRKRSDQILEYVIRPAVKECGYSAVRADEIDKPGLITSQVINHVMTAPLVVADLTERNPNVFYELAIRHALRKPLVQIIRKGDTIPFDVAGTRTIYVDHHDLDSAASAKREIIHQIRALEKDPSDVETPISVSIDLQSLRHSEKPEERSLAELADAVSDLRASSNEVKESLTGFQASVNAQMHAEIEKLNRIIKEAVESLALTTDYMKVGDTYGGIRVTEAYIYLRAIEEIEKAQKSIDVFTSYLLEVDDREPAALKARKSYFATLLSIAGEGQLPIGYRRLIQAPANIDFEETFEKESATYLDHIRDMEQMGYAGKNVQAKFIDRRRPTTFVIIDKRILLWQINQIGVDGNMQIYGMYILKDPAQVFLRHFCNEFELYWETEARPVRLKSASRAHNKSMQRTAGLAPRRR
jgi:hypothetical protein